MKKYLYVVPLVLLFCFTISCQDKAAMAELEKYKAQAKVEDENKEIVLKFREAWGKGEIEVLKEIVSANFLWHVAGGKTLSLEVLISGSKIQKIAFPDRAYSIEDIIVKGNQVVTRYIFKGTNEGYVEGFPATGMKVEFEGIAIDRIENGRIVETWDVEDMMALMQQLGYELKLKEEKKK